MNLQTMNCAKSATVAASTRMDPRTLAGARVAGVVAFVALTAAGAHIIIPLPHTPVPITLQTLIVSLAGVTMGWRLGLASMLLYVLLGSAGYHVFAGGTWGTATIFGPTGGYILGFVLAQPVFALLSSPRAHDSAATRAGLLLAALIAGHAVIFACGMAWLAVWAGAGLVDTVAMGLMPFLPGTGVKVAAAVAVALPTHRWARRVFENAN